LGLHPAVTALIASAGLSILITAFWGNKGITRKASDVNVISIFLFAISLFILKKYKANPIIVMLGCGVAGLILYLSGFW